MWTADCNALWAPDEVCSGPSQSFTINGLTLNLLSTGTAALSEVVTFSADAGGATLITGTCTKN